MAEGLLTHLAGDKFDAFSAGISPTQISPLAIKVMDEIGVGISRQRSKSTNEFLGQSFDYIVTVCDKAKKSCPAFPGKYQKLHWNLEDPAEAQGKEEERLAVFRKVRNQIKENIIEFLNLSKQGNGVSSIFDSLK
jgi:arsenate reductase